MDFKITIKKINYYAKEILSLSPINELVIEFEKEGVGVLLNSDYTYAAYFLNEKNFYCGRNCFNEEICVCKDNVIKYFQFLDAFDCARFIVLNMIDRNRTKTMRFYINFGKNKDH